MGWCILLKVKSLCLLAFIFLISGIVQLTILKLLVTRGIADVLMVFIWLSKLICLKNSSYSLVIFFPDLFLHGGMFYSIAFFDNNIFINFLLLKLFYCSCVLILSMLIVLVFLFQMRKYYFCYYNYLYYCDYYY